MLLTESLTKLPKRATGYSRQNFRCDKAIAYSCQGSAAPQDRTALAAGLALREGRGENGADTPLQDCDTAQPPSCDRRPSRIGRRRRHCHP